MPKKTESYPNPNWGGARPGAGPKAKQVTLKAGAHIMLHGLGLYEVEVIHKNKLRLVQIERTESGDYQPTGEEIVLQK